MKIALRAIERSMLGIRLVDKMRNVIWRRNKSKSLVSESHIFNVFRGTLHLVVGVGSLLNGRLGSTNSALTDHMLMGRWHRADRGWMRSDKTAENGGGF